MPIKVFFIFFVQITHQHSKCPFFPYKQCINKVKEETPFPQKQNTCAVAQREANKNEERMQKSPLGGPAIGQKLCCNYIMSNKSAFCVFRALNSAESQCQAWPPLTNNMSSSGLPVISGEEQQLPGFRRPVSIPVLYYQ